MLTRTDSKQRMVESSGLKQLPMIPATVFNEPVTAGADEREGQPLLDPALSHRFEDARLQYASVLFRWRMFLRCAEVMKYCTGESTRQATGPHEGERHTEIGLISGRYPMP